MTVHCREVFQAVTRAAGRGRAERRLERMSARVEFYERLLLTEPAERPHDVPGERGQRRRGSR